MKPQDIHVLVACEESQRVCTAFRKRGFEAYSCDILECSGGHPEWHIQGDAIEAMHSRPWDLIIAHPPCTYLTVIGNRWFNIERYGDKARKREREREDGARFFMQFINAPCNHIAVENPIGYMNTHYRTADQIIQPYEFGDPVRKGTCLWLKGLPKLKPTNIVEPNIISDGKKTYSGPAYYAKDENGKILGWDDPRTAKERSKTYPGIADAMAQQWGDYMIEPYPLTLFDLTKERQQ